MALEPLGITAVAAGVPGFVRDMGRMDKSIQKVGKGAVTLGKDFTDLGVTVLKVGAALGTALVGATLGLAAGITKLAIDAAPLEGIAASFDGIAESAGVGTDEMLASLKRGSAGLTTNRDLMVSFNKAAALVGLDFAVKLPEAFEFLGRVSQATGQDLGFLLDSLVVGVGRLSPMILDNLGIQVALSEATAEAAKQFGVQESELSKTQQQAGLMTVVMRKLEESTAALPSVSGSATQAFGQFGVTLQNLRDEVGLSLLPAFKRLAEGLAPLVQNVLPELVELFRERVVPAVAAVVDFILNLFETAADAGIFSSEFREALTAMLPQDLQDRFFEFADTIGTTFSKVKTTFLENKDAIIAAIQAIGTALTVAGIFGLILRIGSIIASVGTGVGLVLIAIGLLAAAWETNFLGIRDTVTEFWEGTAKPIFEDVVKFFEENIPNAIDKVKGFFDGLFGEDAQGDIGNLKDTILEFATPIIEAFDLVKDAVSDLLGAFKSTSPTAAEAFGATGDMIGNTFMPTVLTAITNIIRSIGSLLEITAKALRKIAKFWKENGDTILRIVGFLTRTAIAVFENLVLVISGLVSAFLAILAGDWEGAFDALSTTLEQFFENALNIVGTNLDEFFSVWGGLFDNLAIIMGAGLENVITGLTGFFKDLGSSLVEGVRGAVNSVKDFLGLSSPSTLFEAIGRDMMVGLGRGIQQGIGLPTLALQSVAASTVPAAAQNITMSFEQNITTRAETEPVAADFQQMVAQAESVSRRF